ncbi:MAG: hypothetical protein OEX04_11170 [Acidimicrobiia bacterium]|nr:hypothetical protein [Acidimicrobiia bacterium]MDH4308029.1 hypothetical protein [Acidimicrobiia bacterium]MDH5292716.1 hypothetical protein [Acidimicrobiia bacterium]
MPAWPTAIRDRLTGPDIDQDAVHEAIERILSDPRYPEGRDSWLERLTGPVYRAAEKGLAWLFERALDVFDWILSWLDLAVLTRVGPVLVLVLAAAGGLYLARKRARDVQRLATIERILELGKDPSVLEAMAAQADAESEYSEAIRFRFVAGLLRLDEVGTIDFYPGLSNAAISEVLGSQTFDELAAQFDRVVYGRGSAREQDSARSRQGWASLLSSGARS